MTFAPLLSAPPAIQIHAIAALLILPLTVAIFALPSGNTLHRTMGWGWISLMGLIALSSFWIQKIQMVAGFSPIHLLSIITLIALIRGLLAARQNNISDHRKTMTWLTYGALLGAGAFTLLPDRLMNTVLFGT